jgi:SAM-dependent methyltransferase
MSKAHWDRVYETKSSDQTSWTQSTPSPSIEWILETVPDRSAAVVDVGGGTSVLVDHLLDSGYKHPAVIDISAVALDQTKARLGARQSQVEWIEADVTAFAASRPFALWHDRAVFHFLTDAVARKGYFESVRASLFPKGKLILATFSESGPGKCSGLDVMRYDETSLVKEVGKGFEVVRLERKLHKTPWGAEQSFIYGSFTLK